MLDLYRTYFFCSGVNVGKVIVVYVIYLSRQIIPLFLPSGKHSSRWFLWRRTKTCLLCKHHAGEDKRGGGGSGCA